MQDRPTDRQKTCKCKATPSNTIESLIAVLNNKEFCAGLVAFTWSKVALAFYLLPSSCNDCRLEQWRIQDLGLHKDGCVERGTKDQSLRPERPRAGLGSWGRDRDREPSLHKLESGNDLLTTTLDPPLNLNICRL